MILLLTGPRDSGKTSFLKRLVENLKSRGESVGGILSLAEMQGGIKKAYLAQDIVTGEIWPLVSEEKFAEGFDYGRYSFSLEGYRRAGEVFKDSYKYGILILDEIGPVELLGKGFSSILKDILSLYTGNLILVVRESLVKEVIEYFRLPAEQVRITSILKNPERHVSELLQS